MVQHRFDSGTFLVYVDSYDRSVLKGHFCQPSANRSGTFHSAIQLLNQLEKCMDEDNAPQSFQAVRTFQRTPPLSRHQRHHAVLRLGETATFSLRILFRKNASWQGTLTWQDGKQSENFRSVLELLSLLDSALDTGQLPHRPEAEPLPMAE